MLHASNVPRYAHVAVLFTRYGRKDFHVHVSADASMPAEPDTEKPLEPEVAQRARKFAEALKEMGPTYIKFGQILSTRPDIVPPEYIHELEALQDKVEPFSFAEVERILEEELKVRISKAFEEFDPEPLAAASLGQVHKAVLRDGREVVVKVQRPNIREAVEKDLVAFQEIADFLEKHSDVARKMSLGESVRQIRRSMLNELNYLQEARNTEILARNLAEFEQIYIPAVLHDMTTPGVLTMELVHGRKVSKLSPLQIIDHDYGELARVLTEAYLKQICVDGFWHSDPHPGNVFIRDDQLVLLDFGMVSRIGGETQDQIIKMLLSIAENHGEEVAEVCLKLGEPDSGFDRKKFYRDMNDVVATYHDADLKQVNTGQLLFNVIAMANANNVKVPPELAMMAKTLLHLDGITRKLDPDYNPREVVRGYSEKLITHKLRQKFHPRNYYGALLDLNQLLLDMPRRSRQVIDQVTSGGLSVGMKLPQIDDLLKGMQAIANRVTVGLVIAAMIVGSALIMRVPTRALLFGYPALGVIGFVVAVLLGLYMVISSFLVDRRTRQKARSKLK
jgi:ubiquinone biosynthesis protein